MNITNRQHTKPDAATDVKIKVVNEHLAAPKASLVEPKSSGFIHLAAEIRSPPLDVWSGLTSTATAA
jgi:hypothetical protein